MSKSPDTDISEVRGRLVPLTAEMARAQADLYLEMKERAEAAESALAASKAEREALVEGLRPFVALADYFDGAAKPMPNTVHLNHGMTLGDCRRARALISKTGEAKPEAPTRKIGDRLERAGQLWECTAVDPERGNAWELVPVNTGDADNG